MLRRMLSSGEEAQPGENAWKMNYKNFINFHYSSKLGDSLFVLDL